MILCHKCAGTFDTVQGLNSCQCISGYARGFEPELSFEQAATEQVKQEMEWIALFISQGRAESEFKSTFTRLRIAMGSSPVCGHGTIKWKELAK